MKDINQSFLSTQKSSPVLVIRNYELYRNPSWGSRIKCELHSDIQCVFSKWMKIRSGRTYLSASPAPNNSLLFLPSFETQAFTCKLWENYLHLSPLCDEPGCQKFPLNCIHLVKKSLHGLKKWTQSNTVYDFSSKIHAGHTVGPRTSEFFFKAAAFWRI